MFRWDNFLFFSDEECYVWNASVCPKLVFLNLNLQCDSIRRHSLWKVIRLGGMKGIGALFKKRESSLCFFCHVRRIQWEESLTRHWISQNLELILSNLQKCERYVSVIYKLPSLRYFVRAAWTEQEGFFFLSSSSMKMKVEGKRVLTTCLYTFGVGLANLVSVTVGVPCGGWPVSPC